MNLLLILRFSIRRKVIYYQETTLTITSVEIFQDYITACINAGVVAIDTETDNSLDPLTCKIMGLCLYSPGQRQAYIPINHRDPVAKIRLSAQLTERDIKLGLQRILDSGIKIIMHNGKFDYEVLKCTCGICVGPHWDTLVAARLLDENERAGLKEQYTSKIDKAQELYKIDKLFKNIQYADVKPEIFALYSATDSYMTYKLYEYQLSQMDNEKKIFKLFSEIEMPLVVIVAEMELCGAVADLEYCQKLKEKYEAKLKGIDDKLGTEIASIKDFITAWKSSSKGMEKEIVFPPTNAEKRMTPEKLECTYPLIDPTFNQRYKYGKPYAQQLTDPIKLSSPKQLAILLYKVLNAPIVNKIKPNATGKHEIENIIQEVKSILKENEAKLKAMELESDKQDDIDLDEADLINNDKDILTEEAIFKYESVKRICELLSERRKVEKIITTYLNPVPHLAKHWQDGKVRFHLNSLGARTGRFTSGGVWKFFDGEIPKTIQGMNAQNLPSENHEIRLIFKAEQGRIFVGGDISQQEPKITAHLSQDENMLQVYERGEDIYARIAQSIYKNNYEDNLEFYDKEKTKINLAGKRRRKVGKVVILATMYGMGKRSVAQKLDVSEEDADNMLNSFYEQYEGVRKTIDFSIGHAKKYGYVEDIMGRKRHLPNITLPLYQVKFKGEAYDRSKSAERLIRSYLNDKLSKEELLELRRQAKQYNLEIISNEELIKKAERQSFNARIQGSAATLTKKIMVMVYKDKLIQKLGGRIVFQIHDELILDCPIENAETVKTRLKEIMENSSSSVGVVLPMKCDMTVETRWGEDTMTSELKTAYEEFKAKNKKTALKKLYGEFCNFPQESVCAVIEGKDEVLKF